jgi:hypothetical protein
MVAEELLKKILIMKTALTSIKKGVRYMSSKSKYLNISTPGVYERAEIQKYE